MKNLNTVRTYSNRRSATEVLRKLGIKQRDYDLFISTSADGTVLKYGDAVAHAQNLESRGAKGKLKTKAAKSPKKARTAPPAKPKAAPKDKAEKTKPETVSAMARRLILEGFTNPEVYNKLQHHFGVERINEDHKHYPAWYRCQLRRKGELPAHLELKEGQDKPVLV